MKDKIKNLIGKKSFHICMTIVIVVIILFIAGIMVLRYQVEGETNMPFEITKITLISTSEGIDKEEETTTNWAFDINQNNDIYIYVEKNENYQEEEAIRSIIIDNLNVQRNTEIGTVKFYRPNVSDTGGNFSNTEENEIQSLEYTGGLESDIKNLVIGNQGGIVLFRYANNNVAEYISDISTNDTITINQLLKDVNVNEDDLKANLTFDITITTESGREYKANVSLDLPVEGVVENGTSSREITDLEDIVFRRTKN